MKGRARIPDAGGSRRTLLYFPIVHTQADMGALGQSVRRLRLGSSGRQGWARSARLIDRLWHQIAQDIAGLHLCYPRVRIYQDGLPECGRHLEIVTELARAGSRNHKLLLELNERGATIMGTESPDLLLEEYRMAQELLTAGNHKQAGKREALRKPALDALLARRDRFIAARINSTLSTGETGVLFLGALHSVERLLDSDIEVICPRLRPAAGVAQP